MSVRGGMPGVMYERETEVARFAGLVGEVALGTGRALVVDGPAGIGKTSVLAAGMVVAEATGFAVVRASGGEQESDFAFGVVRQLFEPVLAARSGEARAGLLAGAAGLAAPVVDPACQPVSASGADVDRPGFGGGRLVV